MPGQEEVNESQVFWNYFLIAVFALFILNSTTLWSFASNFQKKKKPPTLHYFVEKIAHSNSGCCKVNKTKLNEEDFFSELSLIMNIEIRFDVCFIILLVDKYV